MKTVLPGKDAALEDTIEIMSEKLKKIGIEIEVTSWLNPVPHVFAQLNIHETFVFNRQV